MAVEVEGKQDWSPPLDFIIWTHLHETGQTQKTIERRLKTQRTHASVSTTNVRRIHCLHAGFSFTHNFLARESGNC